MSDATKQAFFNCLKNYIDYGFVLRYDYTSIQDEDSFNYVLNKKFIPTINLLSERTNSFINNIQEETPSSSMSSERFNFIINSSKESFNVDLTSKIRTDFPILDMRWEEVFKFEDLGIYSEETVLNLISVLNDTLSAIKTYIQRYNESHNIKNKLNQLQNRFIIDYTNYLKTHVKNLPEIQKDIHTEMKEYGYSIKSTFIKKFFITFKDKITNNSVKKHICESTFDYMNSKNIPNERHFFTYRNRNSWFALPKNNDIGFSFDSYTISSPIEQIVIEINPQSWKAIGVDESASLLPTI